MNHVGHCLLSYPDPATLWGNFIGDYVKGNDWQLYPSDVQRGILMHRSIDAFTDNHLAVRESVHRVRPFAGRYAAAVTDILYDHLLSLAWESSVHVPFEKFERWVYNALGKGIAYMPPKLQSRLPIMIEHRFIDGYRHQAHLIWVLEQFSKRLREQYDPKLVAEHFFKEIEHYQADFAIFFPEIQDYIRAKYLRSDS